MKMINYALPLVMLLSTGNVLAADLDGEKLYNGKTCASCHGASGFNRVDDIGWDVGG